MLDASFETYAEGERHNVESEPVHGGTGRRIDAHGKTVGDEDARTQQLFAGWVGQCVHADGMRERERDI